jgi:O-antigen ligase
MIKDINYFYYNSNLIEKIKFVLLSLLPIFFILGNLLINLNLILFFFIFLYDFFINKEKKFLKDASFWLLLFLFLSLVINIFFSIDQMHSLPRTIKVILIITFATQVKKCISKYPAEFEKIILKSWAIIFFIVLLDAIFEIIFGFNTFGNTTGLKGRISGVFGDEWVLGAFIFSFGLFFFCYVSKFTKKSKISNIALLIILILISFLIGERANFIKFFISIILLNILIFDFKIKEIFFSLIAVFSIFFLIINFSSNYSKRYFKEINQLYEINTIESYFKNSTYGAQYNAAFKIFLEKPIFGVGLKNYRIESANKKYENKDFILTSGRVTSHPHQIHLELLSETGIFGYICFFVFILFSLYFSIKNYILHKNIFQLSGIIFIIISLSPLIPSGSFFSTFSSGLFWVNYSIMMGYIKD